MSFCDFKENKKDSHKDKDWSLSGSRVHPYCGEGTGIFRRRISLRVPGGSISRWREMKGIKTWVKEIVPPNFSKIATTFLCK